jgi:prepilin signal peptidase PulO-like enzyme (type II secretory pathway)
VSLPFTWAFAVLVAVQASLVALPRAGAVSLPTLARLRSRWWALVPLASIVAVVIAVRPGTLTGERLAWLALVTTPPLAALALGWAARGRRAWLAALVVPLFALAWAAGDSIAGQAATLALTALGCVTLGTLLAAVAPPRWLRWGIVAMAAVDAALVLSQELQPAAHALNIATTGAGLPQFQRAVLDGASMGYGDFFVAATLGAVLARQGRPQGRIAIAAAVIGLAFGLLFWVLDTLPATVPIALALGIDSLLAARQARSPSVAPAVPARAPG